MTSWHEGEKNEKKLEPKFGTQKDGSLKWYDNVPEQELKMLECQGGRGDFSPPIGRLMEHYDVGIPRTFSVDPICWQTKVGLCFPPPNGGVCLEPIPGSADCGAPEAPCGVRGENWNSSDIAKRTRCREAKNVSILDCYAITAPYTQVSDFGKYLCHDGKAQKREEVVREERNQTECYADATVGHCLHFGCFSVFHGPAYCDKTKCKCKAGYCSQDRKTCIPIQQNSPSSLVMASQTEDDINVVVVGLVAACAGIMIVMLARAFFGKRSTIREQPLLG